MSNRLHYGALVAATATVAISVVVASPTTPAHPATFGYFGAIGPAHWADLEPAWEACGAGSRQSPVDLAAPNRTASHRPLRVHYGATTGEVFNDGHTVEVETEGSNSLIFEGRTFRLVQFHFHVASEHRIRGRGYDGELHLVHKSEDGEIAVVGVLLERGRSSGALAALLGNLPDDVDVHHALDMPVYPALFIPSNHEYVHYLGSLTTPPCTEGVHWFVLPQPVSVRDEDLARIAERVHFNARAVQRELR